MRLLPFLLAATLAAPGTWTRDQRMETYRSVRRERLAVEVDLPVI